MRTETLKKIGIYILMIVLGALFLFPILWMISGSLKVESQLYANLDKFSTFLPLPFTIENYTSMFARVPFGRYMFNSIFIVGSTVIGGLFVNSLAGYALARLKFPGRNLLFSVIVALIIVPFEVIFLPLFLVVNNLGWVNTYFALIIPFIANPFSIFLFTQFFSDLPKSVEEAAYVDGAGFWRVYFQIIIPLSKPVFATVAILTGLFQWSRFLWPLVATTDAKYRPLAVGLQAFFTQPPLHWGQILAYSTLTTLPILVVFLGFQKESILQQALWPAKGVEGSGKGYGC